MKLTSIVCICVLLFLQGCSTAPMQWTQETFGTPPGYVKTFNMVPRLDSCDPDAYIDGYRFGYMTNWNQTISKSMESYDLSLKQNPQDHQAQSKYAFYKSKLFNMDSVNQKETRFGFVPPSVTCESDSYAMGRGQGSTDAIRDAEAIRAPEAK